MTSVHLTLNNFYGFDSLISLFPTSDKYEFTADKVFRLKKHRTCSCGTEMVYNGYDYVQKIGFGKVKIGKQLCKSCGTQHQEDKSFWKNLLSQWKDTITDLIMTLRYSDVSWKIISRIMGFLIPCSKGKSMYLFNQYIEQFEYPQDNFLIVNYDEQHPKRGRTQKFRLTLLNYETGVPIAEDLFNNKAEETIEAFLREHLDTEKELVIITDCDRRYPKIFKKIWGNKVIHQKCLLHLNKLVSRDFGKNPSLQDIHNKYLFFNIFYSRKKEIKYLENLLKIQNKKKFQNAKEKKSWLKQSTDQFYLYVKRLEHERRRAGNNLKQQSYSNAKSFFAALWEERKLFPKKAQKRLKMIKDNWKSLTAFYSIDGCPATNNALENFYSTSLKTHRKKQLRTDKGLINHMKLAALKRVNDFTQRPKKSLLEIYGLITLITA